MALRDLMASMMDSSSAGRVFGEPIERDGILIVPVACLYGAVGGDDARSAAEADRPEPAQNTGGGGLWASTPAGTYVLKNGEVTWLPAVNANRSILLGCLTAIVGMLVARSIVRTIVKRS